MLPAVEFKYLEGPRSQFLHAVEKGRWRYRTPVGKDLFEAVRIDSACDGWIGKEGLDLAAEEDTVPLMCQIQRADSDAVTAKAQSSCLRVPQCEGPLSVEPMEAISAPFLVGMQDYFGV